jgi:hypothetical protein
MTVKKQKYKKANVKKFKKYMQKNLCQHIICLQVKCNDKRKWVDLKF